MVDTIVVGIEGTEPSRVALRWSIERAATTGAEVVLVHVVDDEWASVSARIREGMAADAGRLLEREAEYARSLAAGVTVGTRLLHGDVMDELIAASRTASVIAVGTHKTGFIHGKVFGSRSLVLAAAAHSPVAIIPQPSQRGARGVVVGVDASDAGRTAVRFAASEAARLHQTVTFVRASDAPGQADEHAEVQRRRDEYLAENAKALLSEAMVIARSVATGADIRLRHIRRPAAEALLDAAASAALLVVGSSRREPEADSALGSVSHDVLINLTVPTIVVHGSGQPAHSELRGLAAGISV
ncbi:universal stress protein [Parafrigoribacterium mesophilum]|uniref:universal stress protein n=1 Tax=Parafrigoribacterium mesophilum TaxID=433646 RepID=UPI0031FDBB89